MEFITSRHLEQVLSVPGNSDESTLLWGCETWLMRKALANKLKVFLYCNIWRILRVSSMRVCEEWIRNEHVRHMFYNIPRVSNMIAAHQLDFIGKTVHGPSNRPAQHADCML